jgi:hypothetical protein
VRGERDYEVYVAARGATVVRALLVLGLDLAAAEDTAAEVFAVLRPGWHEIVETADPDVALWATVLGVETRRRRRLHGGAPSEHDAAQVLRHIARLEEIQACEVLGIAVPRLRALLQNAPRQALGSDEDDAPAVLPVSYARVRAVAARRRRRQWLLAAGVAVVAGLTAGVVVLLSRPEAVPRPGDALPPARVAEEVNPAGVVWWADGELHLPESMARVEDVRRLVAAGTGAAYVDGDSRLVAITPDGSRTLLGRLAEDSPLVSSPDLGRVAWVDASLPDVTRLVVWDVISGHQVAAVVTEPRVRPITFDGGWLRFGQSLTDWAWDPAGGPAQLVGDGSGKNPYSRSALVDAVAGTRLEQLGSFLRIVRSGRPGETRVPGFGGSLSPDGRMVLTGPDEGREPRLFDARTGEALELWTPSSHARAAVFAAVDRVTWLVDGQEGGALILVTCSASPTISCSDVVDLGDPEQVLLAGDSRR